MSGGTSVSLDAWIIVLLIIGAAALLLVLGLMRSASLSDDLIERKRPH